MNIVSFFEDGKGMGRGGEEEAEPRKTKGEYMEVAALVWTASLRASDFFDMVFLLLIEQLYCDLPTPFVVTSFHLDEDEIIASVS